jgi:hypothetical protein
MKVAAAEFRNRPTAKRDQDRQDIAVLKQLRSRAREQRGLTRGQAHTVEPNRRRSAARATKR